MMSRIFPSVLGTEAGDRPGLPFKPQRAAAPPPAAAHLLLASTPTTTTHYDCVGDSALSIDSVPHPALGGDPLPKEKKVP
ncbi:hypothetical protein CSUB01_09510 [Colletotrichum sublineola]|uniref:Uncharacterized protein n=1 Tax=Colletotrichum sublineola TaxID=1173701 RepID=A0A066XFW7_COLSU|nr:hypothetical protein CSUB01_09510 [Colletotrichum sublineola]